MPPNTLDRGSAAAAWGHLGLALAEVRRFDEAITAHQKAGDIFREVGDHYGHAQTLVNLGRVHAELDDPDRARRAWADAIGLYSAVGADDEAARVRQQIAIVGRQRRQRRRWRR